jgi:hypothetical protein
MPYLQRHLHCDYSSVSSIPRRDPPRTTSDDTGKLREELTMLRWDPPNPTGAGCMPIPLCASQIYKSVTHGMHNAVATQPLTA